MCEVYIHLHRMKGEMSSERVDSVMCSAGVSIPLLDCGLKALILSNSRIYKEEIVKN
jgi:hypothetical protein